MASRLLASRVLTQSIKIYKDAVPGFAAIGCASGTLVGIFRFGSQNFDDDDIPVTKLILRAASHAIGFGIIGGVAGTVWPVAIPATLMYAYS